MIHKIKAILAAKKYGKISFSQSGEDLIIQKLCKSYGLIKPSYIDIGAYHPYILSNTALLYLSGSRGMNIEPNIDNFKLFIDNRPGDINLNIGISNKNKSIDYYQFDEHTLNTFDKCEAEKFSTQGVHLLKKKKVEVNTLKQVINKYADKVFPDILSLDVEGHELAVLNRFDELNSKPKIICCETLEYSSNGKYSKNKKLIKHIENCGYKLYADTLINSIFINRKLIKSN